MRRYDDPVDVRKGMVDGAEGPEQFLWRGRLWKVTTVLAHWVETGAWWDSAGARAVLGTEAAGAAGAAGGIGVAGVGGGVGGGIGVAGAAGPAVPAAEGGAVLSVLPDLTAEREVWRVEASRGRLNAEGGAGVFDLLFDWSEGSWRLARCLD